MKQIPYNQKVCPAKLERSGGFTLIETLIAVLILTISIGGLLSLAAGGFFSVRYARNQIVANNLLQESLEYIRNSRDTAFIQGLTWPQWQDTLRVDERGGQIGGTNEDGSGPDIGCFHKNGCTTDPYLASEQIKECSSGCPYIFYYPDNSFYGYNETYPFTPTTAPYQTTFVRSIKTEPSPSTNDQLVVIGTISWLNGNTPKTITQKMLITNWRP